MKMADDIRNRFITRGSVIGAAACAVLTVADLVVGDMYGLFWNAWYLGSITLALASFYLIRSRLVWTLLAVQTPLVHLSLASGETAILAYFWVFPFPLLVFFVLGLRRGVFVVAGLWAAAAGVILIRAEELGLDMAAIDVVASLAVVSLLGLAYEYLRDQQEHELRVSLVTDELTGIANRRRFNEALDEELTRAMRYERPLSLILFDLDAFKGINDLYGHPTGDAVLSKLAQVVEGQLRQTDLLARLGGDEFAVVVPETATRPGVEVDAGRLAERIRMAVESHDFGVRAAVTVSLGVTELTPEDDHASLVQRADDALYIAKERGRNQVCTRLGNAVEDQESPSILLRRSGVMPAR